MSSEEAQDTGGDAIVVGADGQQAVESAADQGSGDRPLVDGGTAEGQDNPDEGKGDGDEPAKADGSTEDQGVPETYEFTGLPDGMQVDQALADSVTPVFKDLGLNQDQASKLVTAYAAAMQARADESVAAVTAMVSGWKQTAMTDKEIGNSNWKANVDAANAVIRKFGTPELVNDVLVGQGMGNHPEVIRLLARIGKAVADDTLTTGESTDTSAPIAPETRWYGETTPTSRKG